MPQFTYKETWIHRINPSWKLLLSLGVFFFVLFTDNINVLTYFTAAGVALLVLYSGHPLRRLLLVSLPLLLLFVSSATSMVFFGKGDTVWLEWGPVRISLESFVRGLHIGLKTVNFGVVGLLFALSTRPVFLFYSLMQQAKLPPKYAYSFMAAMRLLPLMIGEFHTLRQALKVRGTTRRKGVAGVYDAFARYPVPLLAQSIRRAQRIAVAMEAKRFSSGRGRTYYYEIGFSGYDGLYALFWALAIVAAVYLGNHFPFISISDVRYPA